MKKKKKTGHDNSADLSKRAEEALRESEDKHRTLFETMAQGVVYQNAEGHIISANPAAERILGLTLDEMLGRTSIDPRWRAIHEDGSDFPGDTHPAMVALRTGKEVRNVIMGVFHPADNGYVWININAIPQFKPGNTIPHQVYTTFEDVTERKKAQEALRENEERYKSLIDRSLYLVYIHDFEGRFIDANDAALNRLGYKKEEIRSLNIASLLSEDQLPLALKTIQEIRETGIQKGLTEYRLRHKNGSDVYVETEGSAILSKGTFVAIQAIARDITERKRAEEALQRSLRDVQTSQAQYEQTVSMISDVVWRYEVDAQGQFVRSYVSPVADRLLGLPAGTIGDNFEKYYAYVHPDDLTVVQEMLFEGLHTRQEKMELEYRLIKPDGTIVWVCSRGSAYAGDNGATVGFGTTADITERKRAEDELRISEAKLKEAQALGRIGSWEFDLDNRTVKWSDQVYNLYERDLAMGPPSVEEEAAYYSPEQAGMLREYAQIAREQGQAFEFDLEARLPSGRIAHFAATMRPVRDRSGRIVKFFGTVQDITERKRAEEAVRKSEEKYRGLTENINLGIYRNTIGPEGQFIEANPALIGMFGYKSKEEFLAINVSDLYQNPEDRNKFNDKMLKEGFVKGEELWLKKKDGSLFVGSVSAVAVKDEQGHVKYYDGIIDNISERKRVEEALLESEERSRRLSEAAFEGILIHEEGKIIDANRSVAAMFGYDASEMIGRNALDFAMPELRDVALHHMRALSSGRYEGVAIRKDGSTFPVEVQAENILYKGRTARVTALRDITERKRAEEEAVQHTKNIGSLSEMAMGFVELPAEKDIYWFIGEKLRQLIDDAIYILVNSFDQKTGEIQVRALLADDRNRQAVSKTLGAFPLGISFVVSEEAWNGLINGKLVRVPGGIHELSFGKIPKAACDALEKLAGTGDIFTMGFTKKGELYGSATIIMREGSQLSNRDVVETLVRQAGVALQRKRAEEALRESQKRFQALTETTSDFVWEMDANGVYTYCSPQINELWGYKPEDMIGRTPFDLMIPEDREHAIKMFRTMSESPSPFKGMETSSRDNTGRIVVLETSGVPFFDIDGRLLGYRGISRDITERKRAEDELRKSEAKLKEAQALGRIGSWEFDLDSRTVQWSDQVFRLYERDPAMGPPSVEEEAAYYSPEQAGMLREYAQIAGEQGQAFEYDLEVRVPSGRIAYLAATMRPVRDRSGRIVKLFGTVQDITERKRAEEALKKERQRLFSVLDIMPTYAYLQAPDYSVRFTNRKFRELFGDPGGRPCYEAFYGRKKPCDPCITLRVLETGAPQTWEWTSNKNHTYMICEDLFPSEDDENLVLEIGIDITERKRAEEEVRRRAKDLQEKNEELTRFISAVSHDLRSPLVTIQTFEGHLERDIRSRDAARVEKDLGYISNAADKMGRLLDELLRFSRIGRIMNPSEEAPLQAIVKEALDLVAGRITGRGVRIDLTEEPIVLYGDRARLIEVFLNLVDNAVKFMGDEPAPRVEIGVEQAGEEPVLHVRDNGIGIDPELQPMLFDLFHKLDPETEGEGIGLALVKRIVELHGGRIWVESEGLGKGTTFRFTLAKTRRQRAEEEKP